MVTFVISIDCFHQLLLKNICVIFVNVFARLTATTTANEEQITNINMYCLFEALLNGFRVYLKPSFLS